MPSLTYKEAARRVLTGAGTPLHAHEIARRAIDSGIIIPSGKTPHASMEATLCVAVRASSPQFVRTAPRTFALRDPSVTVTVSASDYGGEAVNNLDSTSIWCFSAFGPPSSPQEKRAVEMSSPILTPIHLNVAALLLLACPRTALAVDTEPNDTCGTAESVARVFWGEGSLSSTDTQDSYETPPPCTRRVELHPGQPVQHGR